MKKVTSTVLLVSLALSACGSSRIEAGGDQAPAGGAGAPVTGPDEPVATPDDGTDVHDLGGDPQRVKPRPGMIDLHPIAWEKARQLPNGRALRVTYWSGVEPCNVLDHVDLRYSPSKITVTLYEGHPPDEDDTACIEIAVQKVVKVGLDQAVDGRKIVDGAV